MSDPQPFLIRAFNLFSGRAQNVRASYHSLKTLPVEHERVHAGRAFHYSDVSTLAVAATVDVLFSIASGFEMHLRDYSFKADGGPCLARFYEDPFVDVNSLGSQFVPFNLRRSSSNISVHSFHQSPFVDVNSLGTQIDIGGILESTGGPLKSISGEASGLVTEWVLIAGTYLQRFTNNNGSTVLYNSNMTYYEPH